MLKTFCHLHDEEGIFRFYVGGALGVDMWAAEQLLYLKEQPGYQDIRDEILYLIFDYPHKHYTFKHFEV